jgi:hypothetical protein
MASNFSPILFNKKNPYRIIGVSLLLLLILGSCTFYTFVDGSSKYSEVKKIRIKQFENNSGNGPPNLHVVFTEKTKDYYMQNGKFELVDINEDLLLEAEITGYRVDVAGATSLRDAQQNKLTITVRIIFTDYQNEKNNIKTSLSRFEVYESNQTLAQVEDNLVNIIGDQICMDIFNGTVMTNDW